MRINKKIAVGTAGMLVVAGTGTALAAAGKTAKQGNRIAASGVVGKDHFGRAGGDDLAAVADYLGATTAAVVADLQSGKTLAQIAAATGGKSTAGLVAALVAHETSEISAAVTAGRLTQAQADAKIAGLTARYTAAVATAGGLRGPGGRGGPGHGGRADDLDAAAAYLGVSASALQTGLRSGETLGQIAAATSGKTTAGLVAALVAHETTEMNAAVTAGRLTQAQADTMIAGLTARITDRVNGLRPAGGFGRGHDQGPRGGWDGGAPSDGGSGSNG